MAEENLRIVYAIAWNHFRSYGGDVEEYIGDGMVGLVQASQRYDPNTGNRFSSFAKPRILGAIQDGIRTRRKYRAGQIARSYEILRIHDQDFVDDGPPMEDVVLWTDWQTRLMDSLDVLPPVTRKVARRILAGATVKAVAEEHGVSVFTIYQQMSSIKRWAVVDENGDISFRNPNHGGSRVPKEPETPT